MQVILENSEYKDLLKYKELSNQWKEEAKTCYELIGINQLDIPIKEYINVNLLEQNKILIEKIRKHNSQSIFRRFMKISVL